MRTESVCRKYILYLNCTENIQNARKVEYISKFINKIKNILGGLSGAQMGSLGPATVD
jgi:hypothetical protein